MQLSLVSRGKNDNYGSFYIERTRFCLSRYVEIFKSLKLTPSDVEIVFVDWGSQDPLWPLLVDGSGFLRYIIVPPEIAKNFDPPETKFSFVHSINTGIFRCKGDYIIHVDLDVYTDVDSMRKLINCLVEPEAHQYQYYFTRFFIGVQQYSEHFDKPEYICNIRVRESVHPAITGPEIFNGGSTAVMASRQAWHDVGGYDERYIYWGAQDVDLFTRWYLYGLRGSDLHTTHGIRFVHMEHSRKSCPMTNNPSLNPRKPDKGIAPNGPIWGLQNISFNEVII
jgi:cellulose synthase/poly-beta-1,6-N-acetylglucosamine synthase-like glycosyltransferase